MQRCRAHPQAPRRKHRPESERSRERRAARPDAEPRVRSRRRRRSAASKTCRRRSARRRSTTRAPALRAARRVRLPVSGVDIGTSTDRRRPWVRAVPSAHQPPSAAGPSAASTVRRCQPLARSPRGSGGDCGVSMPICTTGGPKHVERASSWALTSRCPKPLPRWRNTSRPRAEPSSSADLCAPSRSPVSASTRRPGRKGLLARSRACPAEHARGEVGCRLVADVRRRAGSWPARRPAPWRAPGYSGPHARTLAKSAAASTAAAHGARHLGQRAGGPRVVGDVVLGACPAGRAGLAQQLDRIAEPAVRHLRCEQVVPAADPHRRDVVDRDVPCAAATASTSAVSQRARATAQTRRDGPATPTARALPGRHRVRRAEAGRADRIEPSPSITATGRPSPPSMPACTAAP